MEEISNFKGISFTKNIRILNVIIYALLIFFGNIYEHFVLVLLFFYLHLLVILIFIILELRYVVLARKNFIEHIFINWLVFFGFLIILFDIVKIFLPKR
ncbi:hypothetical protein FLACOL7796_02319 [Flavobacterium collinsii]|uniref:Uncharacterized protein n=1 Tax=Flavobacterium collinsii TaxID=1114861 RepID=A0ABN7EJI6_9FLAO|nr:hypothetical protein FLACOL7796_02319 [Flavobacterium collinsii]